MTAERVLLFTCQGLSLPGILHPGAPDASRGVLVVVGGPQYRVGSHRQFVLLARDLAAAGVPVQPLLEQGLSGLALAEALHRERLAAMTEARREFKVLCSA